MSTMSSDTPPARSYCTIFGTMIFKSFYKLCILCILLSCLSLGSTAQIIINEVCSSNQASFIDNNGDSPDWIELLNTGDMPISLEGYYISDNLDYSYKWQMPNVIIGAGAFLLVIADGTDDVTELRTSFKLAKLGEEVVLRSPDRQLVDHIIVPQLQSDISYGLVNGQLQYLIPSPLEHNSPEAIQSRLPIPTPTLAGGIYQNNISIDFMSDGEVHYKFNNRSKKNEYIYTGGSILLNQTTVVCYWADKEGFIDSPIQCETYFVDVDHSLPLLSVVGDSTDFFSFEEGIFEFGPNAEEEWPHWGANFWSDEEKPVHFQYYIDGEIVYEEDAALQIHGGRESRTSPARSFRMVANQYADQRFEYPFYSSKPELNAVKKIVVRNASGDFNAAHLRDGFLSKIATLNNLDIDALGYEPVVCYLNGKYFGVMGLREKADEYYINQNYGLDLNTFSVIDVDTAAVHGSSVDFVDMHNFIWNNDMSIASNYEQAKALLDINSFIDYFVYEMGLNNKAWPQHNIRFWKSDQPNGKWRYILYDMDIAMYRWPWTKYSEDLLGLKMVEYADTNKHVNILKSLMDNVEFRNKYSNRHQDLFNTLLSEDNFAEELDKMVDILDPEMPRQFQNYPGTYTDWLDYYIARMHLYIEERPTYARQYMDQYFNLGGEAGITINSSHPNETSISLNTLDTIDLPFEGYYFQEVPINVNTTTKDNELIFDRWEINRAGNTIYHFVKKATLEVKDGDEITAIYSDKLNEDLIQNIKLIENDLLFHINNLNGLDASISIYSNDGKKIFKQSNTKLDSGQNILSLPALTSGIYYLNLKNDQYDLSFPITIFR